MFFFSPNRLLAGGILSFALVATQTFAQEPAAADPGADQSAAAPADAAPADQAPASNEAAAAEPATAEATPATAPAQDAPAPAAEVAQAVPTIPVNTKSDEEPLKDTEGGKATRLDAVQVTGSRIKRTDYETAQPVTVINREEIDRSGLTNVGELLARISAAGASVNPTFSTIALGGGEFNLDLRNLGSNRLLVLVNGHRWVNGLNSTGTSSVDLNNIPTAIIERVEVLKDGASAIYGSDAIAGVVNIITRKDYDGQEFTTQYGMYQQRDGARQQHSLSFGRMLSKTSVFANITYSQDNVVKTTTRDVSAYPQVGAGNTRLSAFGPNGIAEFIPNPVNGTLFQCPNLAGGVAAGTISTTTDTNATLSGNGVPVPTGFPSLVLPGYQLTPQQVTALNSVPAGLQLCELVHTPGGVDSNPATPLGYHAYDQNTDGYNRYEDSNLQNPSKRGGLFLQVKQELLDNLNFNFEGLYNIRQSQSQLRPQALLIGDLAGTAAYVASDNIYNPFNQDIGKGSPQALVDNLGLGIGSGVVGMRLTKTFPGVITKDRYNTLHLGGGLDGNFSIFTQNFNWDAGYAYSTNKRKEQRTGDYRSDRIALALGPAADCTGDCVPFDVFHGIDGVTQEMVDYIAVIAHNLTKETQEDAYANMSTDLGPIHLPAGPIALAFGVEYRHDTYRDDPDQILQQGLSSGNNSVATEGSAIAKELYAELGIPLLSELPGAKLMELSLAGRRSIYRDFGGVNTGKAGFRWKPVDDLLLRGTYSSAFRAPSVGELFLGNSDSFETVNDPCASSNDPTTQQNCAADGADGAQQPTGNQLRSTVGGNSHLRPERAHTATFGFVFEPSLVRNLSITADYYSIQIKDIVSQPGAQFILDSCYTNAQRSLCEFVHRTGGNLTNIEDRLVNYSALKTSGIDFGGNYILPIDASLGQYKINLDASYLRQYDQFIPDANGGVQKFGFVGTSGGFVGVPRWKANGGLAWKQDHLMLSWNTRMVYTKMESCVDAIAPPNGPTLQQLGLCSDPHVVAAPNGDINPPVQVPGLEGAPIDTSQNRLKTIFYHDVQVAYEVAPLNLNLTIGVNNLFNQDPPISRDAGTGGAYFNYDVLSYDIPGRFPYVRLGIKF